MFLDLTEFFSNTIKPVFRAPPPPPTRKPINPPDAPPTQRPQPPPRKTINDGDSSNPRRPVDDDSSNPRRPVDDDSSSPRRPVDDDPSSPRRPIDDDDIPIKKGTKRPPGSDADEVDDLNKMKDSDFIKPTDSPADVATKKTLLSQAGDFVAEHPLLTISAAGLAYYMFTTGQSLPDAVASLGLSAGSAIGNAATSAISGLTGIPKEYVSYIWWVLLAILLFYLFMKIKDMLLGE
jgi:hypothetical protein